MQDNRIKMTDENGMEVELTILEETRFNGSNYILVQESVDEDSVECTILKDISKEDEPIANYVMIEDEVEEQAVFEIFERLLEEEIE